jgi:hypothetical protein
LVNRVNLLSARSVATLTKPGRHADGGNLYLKVEKSGAKRWVFFYIFKGRQREAGLGGVQSVPLIKAREKAREWRALLAEGIDPLDAKKAAISALARRRTFGEVADCFLAAKEHGWRNAKHRAQWRMTLENYAAPLWAMPVDEVDTEAVLKALQPIWQENFREPESTVWPL